MILLVNESDTVCYLSYCVDYGYISPFNSDLSRKYVLVIILIWIKIISQFYQ